MGRSGRIIEEEWLVRRGRILVADPVDRIISKGLVQHTVLQSRYRRYSAIEGRLELVGLGGDEAIKIIEAQAGRPVIERPSR